MFLDKNANIFLTLCVPSILFIISCEMKTLCAHRNWWQDMEYIITEMNIVWYFLQVVISNLTWTVIVSRSLFACVQNCPTYLMQVKICLLPCFCWYLSAQTISFMSTGYTLSRALLHSHSVNMIGNTLFLHFFILLTDPPQCVFLSLFQKKWLGVCIYNTPSVKDTVLDIHWQNRFTRAGEMKLQKE